MHHYDFTKKTVWSKSIYYFIFMQPVKELQLQIYLAINVSVHMNLLSNQHVSTCTVTAILYLKQQ